MHWIHKTRRHSKQTLFSVDSLRYFGHSNAKVTQTVVTDLDEGQLNNKIQTYSTPLTILSQERDSE